MAYQCIRVAGEKVTKVRIAVQIAGWGMIYALVQHGFRYSGSSITFQSCLLIPIEHLVLHIGVRAVAILFT
jgi:hypothetical protein